MRAGDASERSTTCASRAPRLPRPGNCTPSWSGPRVWHTASDTPPVRSAGRPCWPRPHAGWAAADRSSSGPASFRTTRAGSSPAHQIRAGLSRDRGPCRVLRLAGTPHPGRAADLAHHPPTTRRLVQTGGPGGTVDGTPPLSRPSLHGAGYAALGPGPGSRPMAAGPPGSRHRGGSARVGFVVHHGSCERLPAVARAALSCETGTTAASAPRSDLLGGCAKPCGSQDEGASQLRGRDMTDFDGRGRGRLSGHRDPRFGTVDLRRVGANPDY